MEFKQGAFVSLLPVKPVVLKYEFDMMSNTYDVVPFFPLFIMQSCASNFKAVVHDLPPFVPNEYLFKKYAASGKEKWQIYAESVREVMAKAGGLRLESMPYSEKFNYEVEMGYKRENPARKTK